MSQDHNNQDGKVPNRRIRRPISFWLNKNSLPTVDSKDKGPRTNDKMTPTNQDVKGSCQRISRPFLLSSWIRRTILFKKIWVPQF